MDCKQLSALRSALCYVSFRNKSTIHRRSVSQLATRTETLCRHFLDAFRGRRAGSGETESGADKIPAMDACLGLSGVLPPTLSPSLRLPFPNMANECLPTRTPLAFIPIGGAGDYFYFIYFFLSNSSNRFPTIN